MSHESLQQSESHSQASPCLASEQVLPLPVLPLVVAPPPPSLLPHETPATQPNTAMTIMSPTW
jgi:hypothetical protein